MRKEESTRMPFEGRKTSLEVQVIGTQPFTTSTSYNALDRVVTTTYPDGEVVTTAYNTATQPVSLSGSSTYVSETAYSAVGQMTRRTLGNGLVTTYAYDPFASRLATLQTGNLLSLAYAYDRVGNVVQIDDHQDILFADSFDTKDTSAWVWNSYQTVPFAWWGEACVRSAGTGSTWDGNFYRSSYSLTSGEALQVRYKGDRTDNYGVVAIETNDGGVYRRFGVNITSGKIYVQYNNGAGWVEAPDLITAFKVGVWYVIRITLDDTAGFTVEVYEENDPRTTVSFKYQMAAGKAWRFRSWTKVGNTYLDSYVEWEATERGVYGYDALDRLVSAGVTGTLGYTQVYTYDAIGNLVGKREGIASTLYTYPTSGVGTVRPPR
jgi:YD repeat-containing protein